MAGNVGEQIGSSAKDALAAVSALVINPVGGLQPAYDSLGPGRAIGAGGALSVIFALVAALGTLISGASMMMMMGGGMAMVGYGEPNRFALFLKAVVAFLIFAAAMTAACAGIRKVLSGKGPLAADVFTVGAALTPLGIALFLGSLLGVGNLELSLLLMLFAMTWLVLMLYAGMTRLGGLTDRAAAYAVPVVFVVSLYICKVIFAAMA